MSVEDAFIEIVLGALPSDVDVRLADVGASGGIAEKWRVFGGRLAAAGFDPLVAEIRRLQERETNPKIRYEAAFVGASDRVGPPTTGRLDSEPGIQPYARSSAVAAQQILRQDYTRDVFNSGAPVEYTHRRLSLDEYFAAPTVPDFIKIDTDGGDYDVVLGARRLLERAVLGLEVEMQFHGTANEAANTFSNIDRFLRARGFSLFDLTPYRYTRDVLPGPFMYDVPAQTTVGQIVWGEAVYFRDLAHPGYDSMFGFSTTPEAALKLCCFFVLFGLPDCAAELLVRHPALESLAVKPALLDLLTPTTLGLLLYAEYVSEFRSDPRRLFPSRLASASVAHGAFSVSVAAVAIEGATCLDAVTATTWHGSLAPHEDGIRLVTAPIPWSYSAEIPLDRSRIVGDGPYCLRVEAKVERGRIGIGALDNGGSRFIAERQLEEHHAFVVVDLEIPSLDDVKQVIVRNASVDGTASQIVIRNVVLYEPAAARP